MWWSEIGFMLFPTRICPVCERHRAISRSHFLCSTCQGKAHAFISRRRHAQSRVLPSGDCRHFNGPMKGVSMQTLRPEILAFVSAAETVLSPALLISPLNDDERDIIQIYLKNLEDLVMQATSSQYSTGEAHR
jgi:hypothetical protein